MESPAIIQATGVAALHMPFLPDEAPAADRDLIMKTGRAVYDSWATNGPEANREFQELLLRFSGNASLHYLYGSYLLTTEPDRAVAELKRCLQLDRDYAPAMFSLPSSILRAATTRLVSLTLKRFPQWSRILSSGTMR